jgi:1-acyl-sn-glycerol-3-phosphate acyltransferase
MKYVPGPGWGMRFLDCIFVKRNWNADKASIVSTFKTIVDHNIKIWLVSFLEGTRITDSKLYQAKEYAKKQNITEPNHVLIPRTKGFIATVAGLREHVDSVIDVTICYPAGIPTMWQLFRGEVMRIDIHVHRTAIENLPASENELNQWVFDRYAKKDELLTHCRRYKEFPTQAISEPFFQTANQPE